MDVELYVYDLSQYSLALTGTQIDAIYHTSIVLNGVEYYFGQGIQTAIPGSTHHGQPMEKLHLGKTELPIDVVDEYLQSLASIYTPESYDLFLHNCNNFTQDLAMFLVGQSIPEHIQNLPQTFLSTPFGQMMKPQLDQALRGVTQAAAPAAQPLARAPVTAAARTPVSPGKVRLVSNLSQLEDQLASATSSCAVIFFTSATCPPCKAVYPTYDELAEEVGDNAVLIKIDISTAYDASSKYDVRATPTFMTFLKGAKLDEWTGADPAKLRGNVRLLVEMAHPTHPHRQLPLPGFQRTLTSFVTYKKLPPLGKLTQKLRPHDQDPRLTPILDFITARFFTSPTPAADTPLPSTLPSFPAYLASTLPSLPAENRFALIDLTRLLLLDPRASSFFAEPPHQTPLLHTILASPLSSPYNTRITTLHLLCNLSQNPHHHPFLLSDPQTVHHTTAALLDPNRTLRTVAASLAHNLAAANHNARFAAGGAPDQDPLPEEAQVELTASLVEAIAREEGSPDSLRGMLLALGLLAYEAPVEGAVLDLCRAMGVAETVRAKAKAKGKTKEEVGLIEEVGVLLERGL
ncbi:bifunctional C97 family peptidase/thioredoxin family protein [Aspergillus clavatus NRRL 1]|uniref:Thioredoxin, putative n=1 Tax=Aspergillus clavatus (strain ATCC 1007 / CBS 513.65 / DSM 816 / NCTC 3887 / NRRL 1 / QM 1276 / 107) TaxID=344612 RepID=A1CBV0_ASPCL|nr:thioredoxin, putative [Aspergillus clavatus NRRL 1]EAW13218.1 thioredoxin, putative [Aspergillus clavatus NRRL 1]